jgi:integrase
LKVLTPIWSEKFETANRLRGRIETILDFAEHEGLRTESNPARWKTLKFSLPARKEAIINHPTLPYVDVPRFFAALGSSTSAAALKFIILTATRCNETLGARWGEIDYGTSIWTVPAVRMKGKGIARKEHRVPLSPAAFRLLVRDVPANPNQDDDGFIFKSPLNDDKPLTNKALKKTLNITLNRIGADHATIHGFRSSFADWCGEIAKAPDSIIERCLAHTVGSTAARAYRRGDALEERRELMTAWANYVCPDTTR